MDQNKNYTDAELYVAIEQAEANMIKAQNIFYAARSELVRLQNIRNDIWWQKLRTAKPQKDAPF